MQSIRFLHLSDLHFRKQYEDRGFQSILGRLPNPLPLLEQCLESEKREGLDFVLLTGDLAHDGTSADYELLRGVLTSSLGGIPWVALPGNHDDRGAFCRGLLHKDPGSALDTAYDLDGLRIITLDSGTGISGEIREDQAGRFCRMLSGSGGPCILAVHHPLLPNQEGLGTPRLAPGFAETLEKSGVAGIFCGHTHRNFTGTYAGKPYFTADSLSYQFEQAGAMTAVKTFAAYTRVTYNSGSFSLQVRRPEPYPAASVWFPTDTMNKLFETT